ncbi:Gti1/Pac2 family-domain-containing protein [Chytriomyces cf. hyalinus JEL632]|nr:Gti1/Pac2 family-domain-containing protein [Chytriomyces cf. hyalinus JEL632]
MQQPTVWHPQPITYTNNQPTTTTPGPSRSHPNPSHSHQQHQRHSLRPYPTLEKTNHETFYGFIHDRVDALILVEACVQGILTPMTEIPIGMSLTSIRSGTVIVFAESTAQVLRMRWRDGGQWSSSRISGSFLLYREVESTTTQTPATPPTLEKNSLFITTSLRPYTRILPNGLAKRTISVAGQRYRVINYFYPSEVDHYFTSTPTTATTTHPHQQQNLLKTPSMIPAFHQIKSLLRGGTTTDPRIPNNSESPPPPPVETSRTNASATSHNLLHQFEKNAMKHGGAGLQQYIPFFKSNPSWHNHPMYLPPLQKNRALQTKIDYWS